MKRDYPFVKQPLAQFSFEAQTLKQAVDGDAFHIEVPPTENAAVVSFDREGVMRISEEAIGSEKISSSYGLFPTSDGFIFIQGRGIRRYSPLGRQDLTLPLREGEEWRPSVPHWAREFGSDKIRIDSKRLELGEWKREIIELGEQGEVGKRLPLPMDAVIHPYRSGLLIDNSADSPEQGEPFYFVNDGLAPVPDALAASLGKLRQKGYLNAYWKCSALRPWVLFLHDGESALEGAGLGGNKGVGLYSASATDSLGVFEVLCDKHRLFDPDQELLEDRIAMNPRFDCFAVLAPHGEDSSHLYFGVMRMEEKSWRPKVFRTRTFPATFNHSLTFSRDGKSLVFMVPDLEHGAVLVRAELSDLVADVNRRYPEAKLDLEALKAEVK